MKILLFILLFLPTFLRAQFPMFENSIVGFEAYRVEVTNEVGDTIYFSSYVLLDPAKGKIYAFYESMDSEIKDNCSFLVSLYSELFGSHKKNPQLHKPYIIREKHPLSITRSLALEVIIHTLCGGVIKRT